MKVPREDTHGYHAECGLARKSTTRVHLFHFVEAGSWTQGTQSFSVTESEFYAQMVHKPCLKLKCKDVGQCV